MLLIFEGVVSTPSPATGYGQSPASNHPYNTPSSGYSPNMPYNPQTPGAGLDVMPMTEWHTVDIEVNYVLKFTSVPFISSIQSISNNKLSLSVIIIII